MSKKDEQEVTKQVDEVVNETIDESEINEGNLKQDPNSELAQLRNIVFGAAKTELETEIQRLRQEMQASFELSAKKLQQEMSEMQTALEEHVNKLDQRITWVDDQHDDRSTKLNTYADKIASELEMNTANNQQQDEEIQKRLDNEIELLSNKFTKQHNQTIDLLNQVKKDLNTSKTDRKTLARLLATVASNLETDEDY